MPRTILLIMVLSLMFPAMAAAQSEPDTVVHAVLYYSPTCPHCHTVIDEVLTPMVQDYGSRLHIIAVDVSQPEGQQLFGTTIEHYQIAPERRGVPMLLVGDTILVGSREIPEQFPAIVTAGLAADGIDWPAMPGISQMVPPTPAPEATSTAAPDPTEAAAAELPTAAAPTPAVVLGQGELSPPASPALAPMDAAVAAVVLLAMVLALVYATSQATMWGLRRVIDLSQTYATSVFIPILAVLGLGVASYLAYVELTHVEAICGPIGDCNIVQTSSYAYIAGVPIAVLGVVNYLVLMGLWAGQKFASGIWGRLIAVSLLGLTIGGTIFSIYLTILELLVIRAVCLWCLSSAVITTVLMVLVVMPRQQSPPPPQMAYDNT